MVMMGLFDADKHLVTRQSTAIVLNYPPIVRNWIR